MQPIELSSEIVLAEPNIVTTETRWANPKIPASSMGLRVTKRKVRENAIRQHEDRIQVPHLSIRS